MREVDTAIGILTLPKELPSERVNAELKGITLFKEIIDSSKLWKLNDAIAKRPIAHCRVGDYKIALDPFETLENCYFARNFHLVLSINGRRVCVVESHNSDVAYIDSLISLLLLGNARWPTELTPKTLTEIVVEQRIIDCELGYISHAEKALASFTAENKSDLLDALSNIEKGNSQDGLASILAIARLKYVCAGWSMSHVVNQIKPFVSTCNPKQINQYFENPFEPSDRIFLENIIGIATI